MKKNILLFVLVLAIQTSNFAQEVPEVQQTLLTKITATWCPNCGSWGWDFFEDLMEDNSDKSVMIGSHHSGDLASPAGEAFSSNFMAPYQPYFFVGNMNMNVNSGNTAAKRQEVKDIVDANYIADPVVNVGFDALISDNTLTVNTNTKFFQEATGEYYLGLYILENNVINNQAANSPMASHSFVLRTSFTAQAFGELIIDGTANAGSEYTATTTLELNSNWDLNNVSVAGIIWEKVGNTYQFVNVNSVNEFSTVSTTNLISETTLGVELFPTIATDNAQLNLDLKDQYLNVNIELYNINGQAVQQVFQGNLFNGSQSLTIMTNNLEAGIYFVNIQTLDGSTLSKKLIVK